MKCIVYVVDGPGLLSMILVAAPSISPFWRCRRVCSRSSLPTETPILVARISTLRYYFKTTVNRQPSFSVITIESNFAQLMTFLVKEFKKEQGIDLSKDPMALQRLKEVLLTARSVN